MRTAFTLHCEVAMHKCCKTWLQHDPVYIPQISHHSYPLFKKKKYIYIILFQLSQQLLVWSYTRVTHLTGTIGAGRFTFEPTLCIPNDDVMSLQGM